MSRQDVRLVISRGIVQTGRQEEFWTARVAGKRLLSGATTRDQAIAAAYKLLFRVPLDDIPAGRPGRPSRD